MPRKARVESKTKIYHVMSRALNKQILFDDEKDYLKFLNIVKSTKSEIDFDLYWYCIMSNHYHLLIKDKSNKLSAIMNKINSRYANYYNLKNARTGYVFNDRYHSENVENVKYFLTCLRYIHQNPIKAGICNKTYEYKFSSIHAYRRDKGNYLDLVNTKFIEEEKVIAILNLIDYSIPLMQPSRVTGFYYNKLQKLRIGKDENTVSLTYKR